MPENREDLKLLDTWIVLPAEPKKLRRGLGISLPADFYKIGPYLVRKQSNKIQAWIDRIYVRWVLWKHGCQ